MSTTNETAVAGADAADTLQPARSGSAAALLLGTLAQTSNQVTWSAVFLTTLMSVFGGTFISGIEDTPLGTVARFTLNYWANRGFSMTSWWIGWVSPALS